MNAQAKTIGGTSLLLAAMASWGAVVLIYEIMSQTQVVTTELVAPTHPVPGAEAMADTVAVALLVALVVAGIGLIMNTANCGGEA